MEKNEFHDVFLPAAAREFNVIYRLVCAGKPDTAMMYLEVTRIAYKNQPRLFKSIEQKIGEKAKQLGKIGYPERALELSLLLTRVRANYGLGVTVCRMWQKIIQSIYRDTKVVNIAVVGALNPDIDKAFWEDRGWNDKEIAEAMRTPPGQSSQESKGPHLRVVI